jgi:uncharacterized DUF497 family protein
LETPGFEWDDYKAQGNIAKHGVTFEEASTVFQDEYAIEQEEVRHSSDEWRVIRLGSSDLGRVLLVVHVDFGEQVHKYRIISARKATPAERRQYESQRNALY